VLRRGRDSIFRISWCCMCSRREDLPNVKTLEHCLSSRVKGRIAVLPQWEQVQVHETSQPLREWQPCRIHRAGEAGSQIFDKHDRHTPLAPCLADKRQEARAPAGRSRPCILSSGFSVLSTRTADNLSITLAALCLPFLLCVLLPPVVLSPVLTPRLPYCLEDSRSSVSLSWLQCRRHRFWRRRGDCQKTLLVLARRYGSNRLGHNRVQVRY